ncbi:MAG: DNA polymerase III subunit beta, partial [Armatimonadetes bacterium CG_4_8_14_3_um_filter_58_9]
GDRLIIQAESQEVGKAYEEVPIKLEGDDIEMAFNIQFLIDVLSVLDADEVVLELTGPLNPGVLRPVSQSASGEDDDYLYVVMPMQK